jgi:hypothetical protein
MQWSLQLLAENGQAPIQEEFQRVDYGPLIFTIIQHTLVAASRDK